MGMERKGEMGEEQRERETEKQKDREDGVREEVGRRSDAASLGER